MTGGGFSIQVETIETGQLLSYGDAGRFGPGGRRLRRMAAVQVSLRRCEPGRRKSYLRCQSGRAAAVLWRRWSPGNVSAPVVVGFGGWLQFKFLFAGVNQAGENRIYAVNQAGELLSYGDDGAPGNVSAPVIVGFGGWLEFKFLFAGVNRPAKIASTRSIRRQLLSYGDDGTPGNVSDPVVVGYGDWLDFKLCSPARISPAKTVSMGSIKPGSCCPMGTMELPAMLGGIRRPRRMAEVQVSFAGENLSGENRIYAVNQSGQLLSYGNTGIPGNVSDPAIIGVNQSGQLLSYGSTGIPAGVSGPGDRRLRRMAAVQVSLRRCEPLRRKPYLRSQPSKMGSCCRMETTRIPAMSLPR